MAPLPLPLPRAPDQTRERLLDAGETLFGRYGYDGVTTRQLAALAQVNQSAIPYHFGGKKGVYLAVAQRICQATGEQLGREARAIHACLSPDITPAEAGDLLVRLAAHIARLVFRPEHRGPWYAFLSREMLQPGPAFDLLYDQFTAPIHDLTETLIARMTGQPPTDPGTRLLAHAFHGQLVGFAYGRSALGRRLDWGARDELAPVFTPPQVEAVVAAVERFARITVTGLLAGIAAPPPAP